jgi:hypothetical protein
MDLHKIGVKFFVSNPQTVEIHDFIPVFHGWIQRQNVDGHLLVDVHDYSHVHEGPGILLVAHEGNFSMDREGGRLGLLYYRKRPLEGDFPTQLKSVLKTALQACRQLEGDAKLKGIKFGTSEIFIVANDRLAAPNTRETWERLGQMISKSAVPLLGGAKIEVSRVSDDARERFSVSITMSSSEGVEQLLARLG